MKWSFHFACSSDHAPFILCFIIRRDTTSMSVCWIRFFLFWLLSLAFFWLDVSSRVCVLLLSDPATSNSRDRHTAEPPHHLCTERNKSREAKPCWASPTSQHADPLNNLFFLLHEAFRELDRAEPMAMVLPWDPFESLWVKTLVMMHLVQGQRIQWSKGRECLQS